VLPDLVSNTVELVKQTSIASVVCTKNLNPHIIVMKPAKDRA